ncbi:hypothetical protein C8R47DRAFT_1277319 [Mycena vitilis]|nr:hypothetical protein C8R47DRAFT_1277319 [Mycena vitilis]
MFVFRFESSTDNYLEFLRTILTKHGEERYNISAKTAYCVKVLLPGAKKGEALDIETAAEYTNLVSDQILEGKPPKLTVVADMADVQKQWARVQQLGSSRDSMLTGQKKDTHEGSDEEDPDLYDTNGLSELDRSLARLRGILEKRWQNDHDAGYTYIDASTGESYALSPQMMKEWCRAMYDGVVNQDTPPWAAEKRKAALHPARIAAGINQPTQGTSDIGHLATILTTIMGARNAGEQPSASPKTPEKRSGPPKVSSPVIPTPSKLPRFLDHTAEKLGVTNAPTFLSPMRRNGYGPDILHLVEDRELVALGINKGDVIRLKGGAQQWWNGPDANKKRSYLEMESGSGNTGNSHTWHTPPPANQPTTPAHLKVAFERRYKQGGAERFWGPRIVAGEGSKDTFYRCPVRKEFVPVPLGYCATNEWEMPADDDQVVFDLNNPVIIDPAHADQLPLS